MYKIIQCRSVYGNPEQCNQIAESGRIKEALGFQKMYFNSHLEVLYNHEMYEAWHEWEIDLDTFTLSATDIDGNVIYTYRVIIREDL